MGEGVEGWMDMYKTGGMDRQPSWGGGVRPGGEEALGSAPH